MRFVVMISIGIVLFAPGTSSAVDDPIVVERTVEDSATPRRAARRANRRSERPDTESRRRQKQGRRKRTRRDVRSETRSAADRSNRVQLVGSFELNLGGGNTFRGEGRVELELDHDAIDRFADWLEQDVSEIRLRADELLDVIVAMPQMLESIENILGHLSQPETGQTLQQTNQMLQLFGPPVREDSVDQ